MRTLFGLMAVAATVGAGAGTAQAQIVSKPIDTNALVVKPVDAATGLIGNTVRFVSRVTASTLDNNALIRTVNNVFGTKQAAPPTMQGGLSPLPHPSQYQSTYYKSAIQPVMPTYQILNVNVGK